MRGAAHIPTIWRMFWLVCFGWMMLSVNALAQNSPVANGPAAPDFTLQSLRSEKDALPDPETLTGEAAAEAELTSAQVEQINTYLDTAIARLEDAATQGAAQSRFATDIQTGRERLASLREELDTLQSVMSELEPVSTEDAPVGEAAMFATEQELLAKESELRALEAQIEGYRTQLEEISERLSDAPGELSAARGRLGDLASRLTELRGAELEPVAEAERKALEAREYFLRQQILALEAEIASLPVRQEILTTRRSLANLRLNNLRDEVLALQELTGQRKLVEARRKISEAQTALNDLVDPHPVVRALAAENLRLAALLGDMAADEPVTSRQLAAVRGRIADVRTDLQAANELLELERIDREAGTTLRRLGNQLPSPQSLRNELRETASSVSNLTRQRVVAQESLRTLPIGSIDPSAVLAQARQDDPALPDFTPADEEAVIELTRQRRILLRDMSATATARGTAVRELQEAQQLLMRLSADLRLLLDENLIWVRSVPGIDQNWPQKVVLGTIELFSPEHFILAGRELLIQAQRFWPLAIVALFVMIMLYRMRPAVWEDVLERAETVGRVKKDNLWNTPSVIGAGMIMASPWPLFFLTLSLLYGASDNPDLLIDGLSDGFSWLAIFTLIVISWQVWDRDKSLFGTHFKMPRSLREAVQSNLKWFLPVFAFTSFILTVTVDMRGENIYEGFSLAFFIITCMTLAIFSVRAVWLRREALSAVAFEDGLIARYRTPIAIIIVGLPLISALLAALGWYDSADDLFRRFMLTLSILLFTYVVYGAIRRAITVAQRQIKYRQAVERREATIKARKEAQEAEERGEDLPVPPPVDTKDIDVSAMSRQSAQLLRTIVAIGLAALLYFVWSGLLPALSIFDSFTLQTITIGQDENGEPITRTLTLWTLIVAAAIAVITIIAARNLPGFLEIFVLDRFGVNAGSRYAITTVIGYIIIATGIFLFFQRLGLRWNQLQWIVTGLSVGIGFGLQKIIANFVSGLIILFERPIRIGDFVTIGDKSGTVTRIKIRATTLGDLDNREILIPNENLISQEVTNWTLSNSTTRVIVRVGIAYGSDTEAAREVMLDVLKANAKVLDTPPPQVFFLGFGDSSLDFEVRFFLRKFEDRFPVSHQVHTEVNKALGAAGFEIPFPQRDINWRGQETPFELKQGSPRRRSTKKPTSETRTKPKASWDSGTGLEDVEGSDVGDGGDGGGE